VLGEAEEGDVGDAVGILVYLFCVAGSTGQTERVSGGDRACFFVTQKLSARRGRPADESMAVGPRSMNFLSLEKI
jgi:hypothetical protein